MAVTLARNAATLIAYFAIDRLLGLKDAVFAKEDTS